MTDTSVRIVSLIPSATEILAALGLLDNIVGRSHECDYPPQIQDRPACTQARLNSNTPSHEIHDKINNLLQNALSVYQVKTDVLEKLQPTHILTQDQCDVCAVSTQEVEKAIASLTQITPKIISLQPNTLQEVWDDIERVGKAFNVDSTHLLENLEARVKICQKKVQGLEASEIPRVACIEWTDPLMVAANWIPELVTFAGGKSVGAIAGQTSHTIKWEELILSNPDVIIFMPCGFDLKRTRQEAELFVKRPEWEKLHASQTGRVYVTDGNAYFNRPGPRLVDSLEILAELLHPEIFQYGYKGHAWSPLKV